jgi:hypothetical protein
VGPACFYLSCDYVLTNPTPPTLIADVLTHSTTRSVYRLHWNTITPWNDFGTRVIQYWNNTLQLDKQTNVMTGGDYGARSRDVGYSRAGNEGDVRALIIEFVQAVHSSAANGRDNAPRPSDRHSTLQRWEQGVESNALAGLPDLVMKSQHGYAPHCIAVMVEAKNPWQVMPGCIDQAIQSIAYLCVISDFLDAVRLAGLYPARLALEQLISHGSAHEGYYAPQGFSIMQALYYLSAVAEMTDNLPETPIGSRAGQVTLPCAGHSTTAALTIQQPLRANPGFGLGGLAPAPAQGGQGHQIGHHQGVQIVGGYD